MDHEVRHGRWPFFHSPTSCSNFHGMISFRINSTKSLGPSPSVNQMCTRRTDHAPKFESADFYYYNICPQKAILKRKWELKFHHSIVVSSMSSSLPQKKSHREFIITTFHCHETLLSLTRAPLLPPPLQNPLDHTTEQRMP